MQENTSFIVFIQFFAVLDRMVRTAGLTKGDSINVRTAFLSELVNLGLRAKDRDVAYQFFKKPVGVLDLSFRPVETVMKASIQSIYETLCEVAGPVKADELFGYTLAQVSKSKAAQQYAPKRFL
jgi:hypothetical protein